MISRKGKKTDRTVLMENCIYDYFHKEYGIDLETEVKLPDRTVPDFMQIIENNKKYVDIIVVEVKQAATDFYTGHGLNFVGSSNYLAVPSELVGFAIEFLRNNEKDYVGVIEVTDKGLVRTVTYPRTVQCEYMDKFTPVKYFLTPYHLREKVG